MLVLRALVALWLLASPLLLLNLFPVRNSGIFLGVALEVVVVLVALARAWSEPRLLPTRSRLTVPLLALAITAVIAGLQGAIFYDYTVEGQHRYAAVQIYAVALVGLPVAAAFAIPILLPKLEDLRFLRALIVASSALLILRGAVGYLAPKFPWPAVALWWPMAATHGAALAAAWVLFEPHPRRWPIAGAVALIAALLIVVVFVPFFGAVSAQWISGWIAVAAPIGLVVVARFPRAILYFGIPALVVFGLIEHAQIERVVTLSQREGDFLRVHLWADAINLTFQRPLFGVGPGNYLDYNMRYGELGLMLSSPHGNYEQIAAEMGFVGLGFAVWLFVRTLALGIRLAHRATDPLVRSVAVAAACSIAGQLGAAFLGDFVVPNYHNGGFYTIGATIYAWVMMGVLIALERIEGGAALPAQATAQTQHGDQGDEPDRDQL